MCCEWQLRSSSTRGTSQTPCSCLVGSPPGWYTAYLLLRKPIASSASSPSTSSWLSTVAGTFHGKGLSRLSGAGKSLRKASRKPRISSATGLLCCGSPEAMSTASRGALPGFQVIFTLRRGARLSKHSALLSG